MMYSQDGIWDDMLPHRLVIYTGVSHDDNGQEVVDLTKGVTYKCYIDDSTFLGIGSQEENVTMNKAAYVDPTPIGHTSPLEISVHARAHFVNPAGLPDQIISDVMKYYTEDGTLYSMMLRFGYASAHRIGR